MKLPELSIASSNKPAVSLGASYFDMVFGELSLYQMSDKVDSISYPRVLH